MFKRKSRSISPWLKRHLKDKYVMESYKYQLRSRAWFKIKDIDQKYKIFKLNDSVIDLGSSPGSWSQYAAKKIGNKGKVISCDIIPMKPIQNVKFYQGNLLKSKFFNFILNKINFNLADVILSDMSANITGNKFLDSYNSVQLNFLALKFSKKALSENGFLISKIFYGSEFKSYIKKLKKIFFEVYIYKPIASRMQSREIFIISKKIKK